MNIGTVVEYIDKQKIIIASIINFKNDRAELLNETGNNITLNKNRFSHVSNSLILETTNIEKIVDRLIEIKIKREELKRRVDIKKNWEKLQNESRQWIDIETMSKLNFESIGDDETSATTRTFFEDRVYFKFKIGRFKPRNLEGVKEQKIKAEVEKKRELMVETGEAWLKNISKNSSIYKKNEEIIKILKDIYLFGKESGTYQEAKELLKKVKLKVDDIFDLMVKIKEWDENENIDILKARIEKNFSKEIIDKTLLLKKSISCENREDFTNLHTITIDSKTTTDFDDAISIEKKETGFILYIHIADVAHYIKRGDRLDAIASYNVSSIYTPDDKIYMLPPLISEDICSLKQNKKRYTITTIINFDKNFDVIKSEVVASVIKVSEKISYSEATQKIEEDEKFKTLYQLSEALRKKRFQNGAMQIFLPEVNLFFNENKSINLLKIDRENPARKIVAEIMIIANNKMAEFLSLNKIPAIFRTQLSPKKRVIETESSNIFLNALQKKFLSRSIIKSSAEKHSGLGLKNYITATSPIRRYFDLINQRQIKSLLNLNIPYKKEEIVEIYEKTQEKAKTIINLQNSRKKFWILRYLEKKKGEKTPAIVIEKRRDFYIILLEKYIIECKLFEKNIRLKAEERLLVTIQNVDAKKDILSISL